MIAVGNNTKHDLTLPRKTALGTLQPTEQIVDAEPPDKHTPTVLVNEVTAELAELTPPLLCPPVNLITWLGNRRRLSGGCCMSSLLPGMEMTLDITQACKLSSV